MSKLLIVQKGFHSELGDFIEPGKYEFKRKSNNFKGEDCQIFAPENYPRAEIKLNQADLDREETSIIPRSTAEKYF